MRLPVGASAFLRAMIVTAFTLAASSAIPTSVLAAPGDLDSSFAVTGRVTASCDGIDDCLGGDVSVLSGDRILVGTTSTHVTLPGGFFSNVKLFRFNADGTPDQTFSGGSVTYSLGGSSASADDDHFESMLPLPGDKVLVAVVANSQHESRTWLLRLRSDGSLDPTWGSGGILQLTGKAALRSVYKILLDSSNRILLVGGSVLNGSIARLTSTGALDTTFGDGGAVSFAATNLLTGAQIVADGTIVAAGYKLVPCTGSDDPFCVFPNLAVVKLTSAGSPVASFNGGNVLNTADPYFKPDLVVQPDGKIVVASSLVKFGVARVEVQRLNGDGTPDLSFDGDGKTQFGFANRNTNLLGTISLLRAPDGTLFAAINDGSGRGAIGDGREVVGRILPDGTLDPGFGAGGSIDIPFGAAEVGSHQGAQLTSTGDLVVLTSLPGDPDPLGLMKIKGGSPSDATPPTVSFATPLDESTVSGTIPLRATATDNVGVSHVEFYVGANKVGDVDTGATGNVAMSYSMNWNSSSVPDGRKTLTAIAYDPRGNQTFADIHVQVSNSNPPDSAGPIGSVLINSGVATTVSPHVVLAPSATDPSGVRDMQFSNDNTTWSGWETYSTFKEWTFPASNGLKTIYVQYRDNLMNVSSGPISASITVNQPVPVDPNSFGPQLSWITDTGIVTVEEAATASANGTWNDFDGDAVRCSTPIGTASCSGTGTGTWSWTWTTDDGFSSNGIGSQYSFPIFSDDFHLHVASTPNITVKVLNVLPTATLAAPASVRDDVTQFTLTLNNIWDPSALDRASLEFRFDCGSGFGPWGAATSTRCNRPTNSTLLTVHGQIRDKDQKSGQDGRAPNDYSASVDVRAGVPAVLVVSPADGSTIGGTRTVSATATDDGAVAQVAFSAVQAGTIVPLGTDAVAPYTTNWDTTGATGDWQIKATATDVAGNASTSTNTVTIDNQSPVVALTAPTPGARPGGPLAFEATVSDSSEISSVQFLVDGAPVGYSTDTASPYSLAWDTGSLSGAHSISARAIDIAGNSATSDPIAIAIVESPIQFVLNVGTGGSGTGSVESSPSGISCGGSCTHTYPANTLVTLTSTAAPGAFFAGWSGDCSGVGTCQVTMDVGRHATAAFTACVPGQYQPSAGSTTCISADIGYYVPTTASTSQTACPIGMTTLSTGSDSASDCVATSLTAYARKQAAADSLRTLRPWPWKPADVRLRRAIAKIDASLASWRWLGQDALSPAHGYAVFNAERKAVLLLTSPLFHGNSTIDKAIADLIAADRQLVANAIAASGDPVGTALATNRLAIADRLVADGNYAQAIKKLKSAWLAVV